MEDDSDLSAHGMRHRPSWSLRSLVTAGWALTFLMALSLNSTTIVRRPTRLVGLKAWIRELSEELWFALALAASVASLIAAVAWLRGSEESPRPSPPQGWGGAFVRGIVLSALLSGALALYLALGGHDILYFYPYTPVGTAALLAPLLGLISIVESREPEQEHFLSQLGWSLVIGLLAFVALLVAWIQREYVNELFLRGVASAFEHGLKQVLSLGSDPLWTLGHFGWIAVPVACSALTRFRPRGNRVWLALAMTGVIAPWWIQAIPAGDAVIATTSVLICVLTPLSWRLGDRARDAIAEKLFAK